MFNVTTHGGSTIKYSSLIFSGGEVQIKLGVHERSSSRDNVITIDAHLTSSDKIMELALVVDALRIWFDRNVKINVTCPYLPYARQDRACAPGEALALKRMCQIINSLNLDSVTVWDVHSDVSMALLDRSYNVPQKEFVQRISGLNRAVLVAPDAGAIKKTLDTSHSLGISMVRADKIRSVEDGSITGTTVYSEHIGEKDFLIVDDICDGGRTFVELAKVLKSLTNGNIYLYVTHGIFSKGLDVFNGLIDGIYTANPFPNVPTNHPLLTVI